MVWDQARIQQLIDDKIEESLELEYKGGELSKKKDELRNTLSKEVSALANSNGGNLIIGVDEDKDKNVPTGYSLIDRKEWSKERIENIITSNIQPRISGLIIHPIIIDNKEDQVLYVIEVPKSDTAHQEKIL